MPLRRKRWIRAEGAIRCLRVTPAAPEQAGNEPLFTFATYKSNESGSVPSGPDRGTWATRRGRPRLFLRQIPATAAT